MLVHLRGKAVDMEKAKGEFAGGKKDPHYQMDAMMFGAKKLFSSGALMALATKGLPASQLLTGKKGKITKLPGIVGGWTEYRDIPAPPKTSFRNEWKKERGSAPKRVAGERVDVQALIEANKAKVAEAHAKAEAANPIVKEAQ